MNKVYAVVSGSYSDYGVHFICPTKEIADALIEKMNRLTPRRTYQSAGDSYSVEELDMVTDIEDVQRRPAYRAWITQDGEIVDQQSDAGQGIEWKPGDLPDEAEVQAYGRPDGQFTVFGVSYRGPDVALKAARDKLAQVKAEKEGL